MHTKKKKFPNHLNGVYGEIQQMSISCFHPLSHAEKADHFFSTFNRTKSKIKNKIYKKALFIIAKSIACSNGSISLYHDTQFLKTQIISQTSNKYREAWIIKNAKKPTTPIQIPNIILQAWLSQSIKVCVPELTDIGGV